MTDAGRRVKSAENAFAILEIVFVSEGATVTEVVDQVDFAKSTVHSYLATLENSEFLVKRGDEYHVSLKFLEYGIQAKKGVGIAGHARQTLNEVAKETGESVGLFVEEHGRLVYLAAADGDRSVRTHGDIGNRSSLHDSAAGKAILAYLPDDRVHEIIDDHGLPAQTEHTIDDADELFDVLADIRQTKVAFNKAETMSGVRAVASPILVDGEVLGAIGVAGPENRLTGARYEEKIPGIVKGGANEIELRLSSTIL